MTTKAIFNIDKKLKEKAMRKAKREGITLSTVLNFAAKAYVEDRFEIDMIERIMARAEEDIRAGRIYTQEEVYKMLGIKE